MPLKYLMILSLAFLTASSQMIDAANKPRGTSRTGNSVKSTAGQTKEADKESVPTVSWAEIKISGSLPEGPSLPGLFGEIGETMNRLFERLDAAARDEKIKGIVLKIDNPSLASGGIHELRTKILDVRKSGKPVYAFLETAMTSDYLVASACDKIFMPEPGMLLMTGMRAEVSFYRNLLDKLDIQADILRVGKFKSAAEPYTRTEMSPEFKQEIEELLDDRFAAIINIISKSRGLKPEQVKNAIDSGPHTPSSAVKVGLIDAVRYRDEVEQLVMGGKKGVEFKLIKKYGKKKIDTNFEGFSGMMKMMELLMGVEPRSRRSKSPQIAVIYASGAIMPGRGTSGMFGDNMIGGDSMVATINKAAANDRVKAIVLRVNSPGGSALASDLIWRALEKVDKPIVVSMADVAASGGYYISMGADHIFAEPGTVTGSIGVVGGKLAFDGLFKKLGITTSVISRGKNSGALSATSPFTDSERLAMQKMMNEIYEIFTRKAAQGRGMDVNKLKALAGGRIYTGRMAVENGLIDELGTLEDAILKATQLAGLDKEDDVQRLLLPKPTSPFEQLFGPIDAGVTTTKLPASLEGLLPAELSLQIKNVLLIDKLSAGDPRLLMMPFNLQIK